MGRIAIDEDAQGKLLEFQRAMAQRLPESKVDTSLSPEQLALVVLSNVFAAITYIVCKMYNERRELNASERLLQSIIEDTRGESSSLQEELSALSYDPKTFLELVKNTVASSLGSAMAR